MGDLGVGAGRHAQVVAGVAADDDGRVVGAVADFPHLAGGGGAEAGIGGGGVGLAGEDGDNRTGDGAGDAEGFCRDEPGIVGVDLEHGQAGGGVGERTGGEERRVGEVGRGRGGGVEGGAAGALVGERNDAP